MSQSPSHSTGGHGQPHVGSDEMNLTKIVAVGVVSLVVFAVGIVCAYFLLVGQRAEIRRGGPERPRTEVGKAEIGIVDQVLFSADNRLEIWRADHKKRLESYGWIDKAKGVAHIPIEQAMAKVVASPPDIPGEGVPPVAAAPAAPPEFTGGEAAKSGVDRSGVDKTGGAKPASDKAKGSKR
jgi:hypothetical protein